MSHSVDSRSFWKKKPSIIVRFAVNYLVWIIHEPRLPHISVCGEEAVVFRNFFMNNSG